MVHTNHQHDTIHAPAQISGVRMDVHRPTGVAALLLISVVLVAGGLVFLALRPFVPVIENIAAFLTTITGWLVDRPVISLLFIMGFAFIGLGAFQDYAKRKAAREREERLAIRRGDTVLPFSVDELDSGVHTAAIYGIVSAEIQAAKRPMPNLTSYSYHQRNQHDAAAQLPGDIAAAPLVVPTFSELLTTGQLDQGDQLVLGVDLDTGEHLAGSWLDLYSTAVAGLSGTGKTTSQRFIAGQTALSGARFVVVDKHYGAGDDSLGACLDPLGRAFLCDVADTEPAILQAVRAVADIGERRITGKDHDTTPVVLWVDEATALLGHSTIGPQLSAVLEQIAQQYRKKHVYASISGQIWTASRTGGTELRDSLASVLAHRMKRNQARLLLPTDDAQRVERLERGQAILWKTSGESNRLAIPNTTASDLASVADRVRRPPGDQSASDHATADARWTPDGRQMDASDQQASAAAECDKRVSPEAARAAALFVSGMAISEVTEQITGVKPGQGRKSHQASMRVQALIRAGLQQGD